MKKKKLLFILISIIIFFFVLVLVYYLKREEKLLRTINAEIINEDDFIDIEYNYSKNLERVDLDMDLVKKNAIEEHGSSTINDIAKYNAKSYRIKEEEKDGVIYFSETSEYAGFQESDSDEFIFNKIINGITTNRTNAKIENAWIIEFQDGTKGYMYSFYNRIGGNVLYEINMECWSEKYYYALEAITPNNDDWDYLMDEVIIIISSLKHKNLTSIKEMTIYPYDLFDIKRIDNIVKDYLAYKTEDFRDLCTESDSFCNGLDYYISSIDEISKNVFGAEISVERYNLEKSAKQLFDKNKGKTITLQEAIDYAKEENIYIECKTTLELNLNTGEIIPDIHFNESFYGEGFSVE